MSFETVLSPQEERIQNEIHGNVKNINRKNRAGEILKKIRSVKP